MDTPILSGSGSEASSGGSQESDDEKEKQQLEDLGITEDEEGKEEEKEEEVDNEVVGLIRNLTTLFDMVEEDWTRDVVIAVGRFAANPVEPALIIYYQQLTLQASTAFPSTPVHDIMFYFRKCESVITLDNFFENVTFGNLNGNMEGSILNLLQHLYAPAFFENSSWPEGVKGEFFGKMHEFLAHLTDLHFKLYGLTILYVPHEGVNVPVEEASKNKELVRRLEGVMTHWSRQLRVAVSDVSESSSATLLTPTDEYQFWEYRWESLTLLLDQLEASDVKHILDILTLAQSSYLLQFRTLQEEMVTAVEEAVSNIEHLQVLLKPCEEMTGETETSGITKHVPRLLNLVRKIWTTSPHYNTPARLIPLCRSLTNQVILQCKASIQIDDVFDLGCTQSAIAGLRANILCCRKFRFIYEEMTKAHSKLLPEMPWDLDIASVFGNMDSFVRRNLDLIEVCEAMSTFARLTEGSILKPVFGGTKGKDFGRIVDSVEEQFMAALREVAKVRDIILDVLIPEWQQHMLTFRTELTRLERSLLNLLSSAMEQVTTVEEALLCLQAFHHYSCRPAIYRLFEQKTEELWGLLLAEVHSVRQQLLSLNPVRHANAPPHAGPAFAANLQRLRLLRLKKLVEEAAWLPEVSSGPEALAQLDYVVARVDSLVQSQHLQWNDGVEDGALLRLERPLVRRCAARPGLLEPNFDLVLMDMAHETMYWQQLGKSLPHPAEQASTQWPRVRLLYENVLSVVIDYNKIISALSDEERLLFKELIRKVDQKISAGLFRLNWNLENSDDYILRCSKSNAQLFNFVEDYKAAISEMTVLCGTMCDTKMLDLPPGVVSELAELEEQMETYRTNAFIEIMEIYQSVLKHLVVIYNGFEEVIPATGVHWHRFVLKLDAMLEEALVLCVKETLQVMLDALKGEHALINVSLNLQDSKVKFTPTLRRVSSLGNHFLAEVVGAFKVIPRIYDKLKLQGNNPMPFHDVIDSDEGCRALQAAINAEVSRNVAAIQEYLRTWEPYRRMWDADKDVFVAEYRLRDPAAVDWEADIAGFDEVANAALLEEALTTVHFTRLDSGPLKMGIAHHCSEWKARLCNVLLEKTTAAVDEIFNYCEKQTASVREEPRDLRALQAALVHHAAALAALPDVEARFPDTDNQFAILLKNDVQIPPDVSQKRQQLLERWEEYHEVLNAAKVMLESSKESFKASLLEQSEARKVKIADMALNFKESGPFSSKWTATAAVNYLSELENEVENMERLEEELGSDLAVFDVSHPDNPELEQLGEDLAVLQSAWSVVSEWQSTWHQYKGANFWKLDTDAMEDKTLELSRKMARMGAELQERGWNMVDSACSHVDAVRRCLPLIAELKNPALRLRHWRKIQDLARADFDPQSNEFTVGAVLDLKLHEHSATIFDISKTATLELGIEKGLSNIKEVWASNRLTVEPYKDMSGIFRLLSVDDIVQTIEEHQTILAAMKGTKFVESFLKDVEYWEKTLSTVDEGLELLLTVQRQWVYLENIFTGEDIRRQLPEETSVFEGVTSSWRGVSSRMHEQLNAVRVCHQPGLFPTLNAMLTALEDIQKALAVFLESKRYAFPRFYFISNDDLLEILGNSKKPELIQPHLKKLFDNIVRLGMERGGGKTEAQSMMSADGEMIPLVKPVLCDGAVEAWLAEVETAMKATLRHELKATKTALRKSLNKRDKWVKEQPGQLCITASQIQWTTDCTRVLMSCHYLGNRAPLKKLRRKQKKILHTLSDLLRSGIPKMLRLKVVALVTIEIHARDVVDTLYKANCTDVTGFEWTSQLRFYWDKSKDDCAVRQTNTCFSYGYEYLGNSGRLAITPLTDRCYITLTTALHLHRGGSPKGPAGTGKTETVKDLGKALGAYVIVFNCSEGLDYRSMGRLFSGLAQTGAWGCFDEFNRINVEVLSVVAQQILSVLSALSAASPKFIFEGTPINVVSTCGIFITMNPGYAGRTELPDNLKAMFRPISMVVPDSALIAEVTLYGEGFHDSKSLANKVVTLFSLSKQQLSKQDHYDFGLRGMVSLLRYAGTKRRALPHLSDGEVVLLAMRDMNIAKLTSSDLGLFTSITRDLFPGIDPPVVDLSIFRNAVAKEMEKAHLQPIPAMINKVIQLHETQSSRHSVMLVGNTCTGKSATWRTLKATLSALSDQGYQPAVEYPVNPKTLTLGELFGEVNLATGEWLDGVISSIMRKVCSEETPEHKWVVFDGPVDAVWIENMNSAMDDNKILTLINSERITMPEQVSFLFEVENLRVASPATVSRAGMVYTDYAELSWRPYVESWLQNLESQALAGELRDLIDRLLPRVLEFKRVHCKQLVSPHELASVRSLCRLLECFCIRSATFDATSEGFSVLVKLWFLFCLTWSVCGTLDQTSRRKMDTFIRETENVYPVKGTIYEYYVDPKQRNMSAWENKLDGHWAYNQKLPFHDVVVPTVDTLRYECLASAWLDSSHPQLLVGPVGVGKTCILHKVLSQRSEARLCAGLSASTSARALQELLESRLEKRTKGVYAPTGGRRLVVFLDDLNMPARDEYGSQPPLELMRQWLDYGFWYDRQKQWKKHVKDIIVAGAMGPPGGGRNPIPNRLLSWFNVIAVTFPEESQVTRIYLTLLRQHLASFDEEVKTIAESLSRMTVELFSGMVEVMLPTPKKTHYLFNLRDISRVFQGLLRSHKDCQNTSKRLLSLWAHEVFRVFCDRLVDDADRRVFTAKVDQLLGSYMDTTLSALCPEKRPSLFGDFMNPHGRYEELEDAGSVRRRLETLLVEYNQKPGVVPLRMVLFRDAVEHVCRIARVVSQPLGHVLLVGIGGSGRSSLARLALHLCEQRFMTISVTRNYRVPEFREDLKVLYRQTGVEGRPTGFLLSDNQIVVEEFLEIINSVLGTGEVPNLYRSDELDEIRAALSDVAAKMNTILTSETILPFLIERARWNLHVVLSMNPVEDNFRLRLMRYPALVSCTTIDWFLPWPKQALVEVAVHSLVDCNFMETIFPSSEKQDAGRGVLLREIVARVFADMHSALEETASDMWRELRRMCYVTPTNFLHLISTYVSLLTEKREALRTQANTLRNGLGRIEEARDSVAVMSVALEKAQAQVLVVQEECEAAMAAMGVKRREADEQAKLVKVQSERIAEEEVSCRALAQAAQDDLDEALPALEEAMSALESLSKKDISELKSYGRPPPKVMMVMEAVCILKGVTPDWAESKRILGEQDFLRSLKEYDKDHISEKTMKKIASYTAQADFDPERVESVSLAARSLCMWVIAIENYGKLWRIVGPKKARLEDAMTSLRRKQEEVAKLTAQLDALKEMVNALNEEYLEKTREMDALKSKADGLQLKLERAGMLVDGLAEEKLRWETTVVDLQARFVNLPGDCLVASAFLSYAGPFLSAYRTRLMETWLDIVSLEEDIIRTPGLKLLEFLVDPAVARDWGDLGLPMDDFSIENGILVVSSSRSPLVIDPQLQANKWIKNMERPNNLTVLDEETPDLMKVLESCILAGTPVLLQNVPERIEPALTPVLGKVLVVQAGQTMLKLGDKLVTYNPNFRLFVTTKLSNPHFSTEISTKTTVVNFLVKQEGLEAQLLGLVVRRERPELEDLKTKTLHTISVGRKTLLNLEAELLRLLYDSEGSLLENEELFKTLQDSRRVSKNIKEGIETAEVTEVEIEAARAEYIPCAVRSAILFVALNELSQVDPMYQFSLDAYLHLFNQSLEKSARNHVLTQRIRNINEYHTYAVYRNACCVLFGRHKLLFSFYICIKILENEDKSISAEYDLLVRGGVVLKREAQPLNPATSWLNSTAWNAVVDLEVIPSLEGIVRSFQKSTEQWKEWYLGSTPESSPLFSPWTNLSALPRLLLVRALREDRLTAAIDEFVKINLGVKFTEPPVFDIRSVYEGSSPIVPLIFILSPGVDPTAGLVQFAENQGMTDSLVTLSLGQGQAEVASRSIERGVREGHWVFLANCHLSLSWMPALDKIVQNLRSDPEVNPKFRLWLSSSPHRSFPISILQDGIKMTTEPPQGLRGNLTRLYQTLPPGGASRCKAPHYPRLLYSLAFFHAVLLERRKFQQLGWNVVYSFNDSDFEVSESLLSMYLDEYEETPWEAIKYLIAEVSYGGHVTDAWDRRLLMTYANQFLCQEVISDQDFRLSSLPTYVIPRRSSLGSAKDHIAGLPVSDPPEAFGQHANAEINYFMMEARSLCDTLLSMQAQSASDGATPMEEKASAVAEEVLTQLPALIDLEVTERNVHPPGPLDVVLLQEGARYNALLKGVLWSLRGVQQAISGHILMSPELEEVFICLYNGRVPPAWLKAYPSLKPLGSWTRDLVERVEMLNHWAMTAHRPLLFWPAAFTFPTAFLTAVLQQAARSNGTSVDLLTWEFAVIEDDPTTITEAPEEGMLIRGLFLEGAGWDSERSCLTEPMPMQLVCDMPVIWFKPTDDLKPKTKGVYSCPAYYYPIRSGSFVVSVDLQAGSEPPQTWIKRGTALLLSVDT